MNLGQTPSAASSSRRRRIPAVEAAPHPGHVRAVVLDVDADEAGPLHLEGHQGAGKGRPIHEHHVAGLEEKTAQEIETVLARGRDEDVLFTEADVVALEEAQHGLNQTCLAGDRRVLHDEVDVGIEGSLGRPSQLGPLEDVGGWEAAGERDDLRVGEVLERLADRITLVVADVFSKAGRPIFFHETSLRGVSDFDAARASKRFP
jgi:hypothetical protein